MTSVNSSNTNMAKTIVSKLAPETTNLKKGGRRRYKHKGGEDVVLEEFGEDDELAELAELEGGKRHKHRRTIQHKRTKRTRRHKRTRTRRHR